MTGQVVKRLSALALLCGALLPGSLIGARSRASAIDIVAFDANAVVVAPSKDHRSLASPRRPTMVAEGRTRKTVPKGAAGGSLQQSPLQNRNDRDSVGFFQMRTGVWQKSQYSGYGKKSPKLNSSCLQPGSAGRRRC
jgi:hypothetical protein